jgi:lycopene beta-cyclase
MPGPLAIMLVATWLLSMIAIPIILWTTGPAALPWTVGISVALLACGVTVILAEAWGVRAALTTAALILVLSWLIELMGSTTGFPFGSYYYANILRPQILGVPVVVPLAWLMMLPPAWAVAAALTGATRGWRFVAFSAAAFTAWDLFLDPQMVGWRFWVWNSPGAYFGIPLLNFAGWFVASALLTVVIRPAQPPIVPLLSIFTITWLLQTVGLALFWGLPGPALFGFLGMGAFTLMAWRTLLAKA